jgi:hypothetical protein
VCEKSRANYRIAVMLRAMRIVLLLASLFAAASAIASDWPAQRADLEFARDRFVAASPVFSKGDRKRAVATIDQIIAHGRPLSNEAFLLAMLRIAASSGNAHEGIHGGWRPATRLPFRMIWFPDAMVIARAAPEYASLLGARVESIEGLKPRALQARLRPYVAGSDNYLRWNGLWLVETGGMLHAMGVAREPGRLRMRLRTSGGQSFDVSIPFVPREAAASGTRPPRLWSAAAYASEAGHGWRSAIDGPTQPLYLREDDEPFRMVTLATLDALYVQFRANSTADADGRDIAAFVRAVREEILESRPAYVVLDLRFDTGGDIDQTRELSREMARAVPGRIFVLTGPYTFSAGIVFAAAIKHDARDRVVLVGEPVGDRLRFWSEGSAVCTPRSGYCFQASSGLWDLTRGCAKEAACYGDRLDARVDSLDPDIPAPLTSRDWLSGRDPGMEAVAAAIMTSAAPRSRR